MSNVAAILLAAGRGTRFGSDPKLLARVGGRPLVHHAASAAVGSRADPVIVVTGHHAEEIERALEELPIQIVRNTAFMNGLSTSLKAGFAALPPQSRAAIVLLGDMPMVEARLIDALVQAWHDMGEPMALVPTIEGRRGNPVVLSRDLADQIERLSGDSGAGPILRGRSDVVEYPVDDPAILQDVDTPADFDHVGGNPRRS
ncbi:NTP transferase domain-containing protein [Microvirga sp. Mcv34]|uniref:nucleotidyltransferase family protein n=1 Tax=Microvirga sp. Mcv34 TaxID=2926016 RepID=UPI0021C653F5|nr:nucleotidyltransferase family protein [Microvirga sp. Mcv34]